MPHHKNMPSHHQQAEGAWFISHSTLLVKRGVQYSLILFTLHRTVCLASVTGAKVRLPPASNASSNPTMSVWSPSASFVLGSPSYDQVPASQPMFPRQDLQQRDRREGSKTCTVNNMVPETKHIY
jgi:hypothetical protein